jgi:hypothetical protein
MITRRAAIGLLAAGGGLLGTTESDAPDLVEQLQAHVSSMYTHLNQHARATCMSRACQRCSATPPATEETTEANHQWSRRDRDLERGRDRKRHPRASREVSGFERDGMPAMMRGMMGQ